MQLRLFLGFVALATSGCVSEPPPVVVPGGRSASTVMLKHIVRDAAVAQRSADQKVGAAVDSMAQLVGLDAGSFVNSNPALTKEIQECEAALASARQYLREMESRRRDATAAALPALAQASTAMSASQASMENVLERLQAQLLYLKQNLNAKAVVSRRASIQALRSEAKRMHALVRRSDALALTAAKML